MKKNTSFNKIGMVATLALLIVSAPFFVKAATLNRQLQFGMYGSDISLLQSFLARDASIYPQGLVTGYFGGLTRAAVARFQVRNGISPVGRVGPQTLPVINAQMNAIGGSVSNAKVIGPINVNLSGSQANIAWNTTQNTAGVVYYSNSPITIIEGTEESPAVTVSGTSVIANVVPSGSHNATLSNLSRNTTYYFLAYVRDAVGNENITLPSTFTTSNF